MKIGIITFHTALNYGAVLQTYALMHHLEKEGQQVEIIDYRPKFNKERFSPKPLRYFLSPKNLFSILFRNSYQIHNRKAFEDFCNNFLHLSKETYSLLNLSKSNDLYDLFVTGSDQVWNLSCTDGDDSYFLPFVSDQRKKYSYAASFGVTDLLPNHVDKVRKYLSSFDKMSVREKEGCKIISDLFHNKVSSEYVLDPTLLLTKKDWYSIADFCKCPGKKYLLVYLMSEDMSLLKFASSYAKRNDLHIIYLTQRLFKRFSAEYIKGATPNQWLGLFLNADTIITNSFHGTVFSLNFNKNFFVKYIPKSISNSRLKNIIDDFNLHNHLLDSSTFNENSSINYEKVNPVLQERRTVSYNYIKSIINDR